MGASVLNSAPETSGCSTLPRDGLAELEHPFGVVIPGSRRNIEPYIDVEYYRKLGDRPLGIIVSADIRDRTVYNYEKL